MTDLSPLLKQIAGPGERGDKIKVAIERAANATGLSYWRAFDIWYGKARLILPDEEAAIMAALVRIEIDRERKELHQMRTSHARFESRLNQMEAAFNRAVDTRDFQSIQKAFGAIVGGS